MPTWQQKGMTRGDGTTCEGPWSPNGLAKVGTLGKMDCNVEV